tara:strand:+ start:540 stop:740 length:201 start_codon:yes stop_codon:yes gene_type:complete
MNKYTVVRLPYTHERRPIELVEVKSYDTYEEAESKAIELDCIADEQTGNAQYDNYFVLEDKEIQII